MSKAELRQVEVSKRVWHTAEQRYPEFAFGAWVQQPNFTGWFHAFGLELYEDGDTTLSISVAIVEDPTGQIHTVMPDLIKFISA
jgi:hypothetical protein